MSVHQTRSSSIINLSTPEYTLYTGRYRLRLRRGLGKKGVGALYQVIRSITRPPKEKISVFQGAAGGVLSRGIYAGNALDWRIQPLKREWHCVGPAVTVQIEEPDAVMPILAMELAQPGDVIVVAVRGRMDRSTWGAAMTREARERSLAGAVIDGAVNDAPGILGRDFPVFCRGITPAFEWRNIPGSINVPVVCGGVVVRPGDLMIGSADGVVVIPADRLDAMIEIYQEFTAGVNQRRVDPQRTAQTLYRSMEVDKIVASLPLHWED
jgi:4-hydroxy-4-methyl-2-oxoglutarate aldolase